MVLAVQFLLALARISRKKRKSKRKPQNGAGLNMNRMLQKSIEVLKREQQLRKDAMIALTPDFWEIQRSGKMVDGYRKLELAWAQEHLAVQLHCNPKYRVAFPSPAEVKLMQAEVDACWNHWISRRRRISRRPFNSSSEL